MSFITETNVKVISKIENLDDYGLPVGDCERTEGEYQSFIKDIEGGVLISYTERDDSGERIMSEITVKEGTVTVKRVGAITTEMRFAEGEEYDTLYSVGPYSFDARIVTKRVRGSMSRLGGEISVHYELTVGGAKKKVQLRVVA